MEHNLRFSTDPNPVKCKTKTMAFLKKIRPLPNLNLCGNPLPWTEKCKHLGITAANKTDGCQADMKVKNAMIHSEDFLDNFPSGCLPLQFHSCSPCLFLNYSPWQISVKVCRSAENCLTTNNASKETDIKRNILAAFITFAQHKDM